MIYPPPPQILFEKSFLTVWNLKCQDLSDVPAGYIFWACQLSAAEDLPSFQPFTTWGSGGWRCSGSSSTDSVGGLWFMISTSWRAKWTLNASLAKAACAHLDVDQRRVGIARRRLHAYLRPSDVLMCDIIRLGRTSEFRSAVLYLLLGLWSRADKSSATTPDQSGIMMTLAVMKSR